MIGRNVLEISAKDFIKGMSSGANITDGGFSSETDACNPIYDIGVLYAPALQVNHSTNLSDNIIASTDDPNYLGHEGMMLDDSGNFYWLDTTTLTKKATTSGDLFTQGTTDFVAWNGIWLATTKVGNNGDIVRWDGATTLTENYWTSTLSQSALSNTTAWRPLLVYETFLYIGDKNKLHRVSTGGTVSNGILTLDTFETISALGIDKNSGLMLIATTQGVDLSASRNSKSKILLYDGISQKVTKVVPVSGTITAFKNIDDRTVVFVGNRMGYWTGNGIKFLRKMNFALGTASKLVYPHRTTVIDNTIYFAENSKVIAWGDISPGTKVFYPAVNNSINSNDYTCIQNIGGGKLGLSFGNATPANAKFYTFDTTSVSDNDGMTWYSHKYAFPKFVDIKDIYIEYADAVPTLDNNRALYFKTQNQGDGWIQLHRSDNGQSSLKNASASNEYEIQSVVGASDASLPVKTLQLKYVTTTTNIGLRRIIISYDV